MAHEERHTWKSLVRAHVDNHFCTRQCLSQQIAMMITITMIRTIEGGITDQQMIATLCQRSPAAFMGLQSIVACPRLLVLPVLLSMAVEAIVTLPEAVWVGGAGTTWSAISASLMPWVMWTPGEAA